MSVRTPKDDVSRSTANRTKKSGEKTSGKKSGTSSSKSTRVVGTVEILLKFPITQTCQCTGKQNIMTSQIQSPHAIFVIKGSTKTSSPVPSAEKFAQHGRMEIAILALTLTLNRILELEKSEETKPRAKPGKSSMPKPTPQKKSWLTDDGWT